MFDEPGLGCTKLLGVNEDETARLSKGLQHKCCQPRGRGDGGGGVRDKDGWEGRKAEGDKRGEISKILLNMCWQIPQKILNYQEFDGNQFFNRVRSFPTSRTLSICQQKGSGADRGADGGMFLSKIEGERTGMYRWMWGNGKKERKWGGEQMGAAGFDQLHRMRQLCHWECEISRRPIVYSIFLHVRWRFPKSILQLTQIPGTKVVNLARLGVQLRVYEASF